MTGSALLLLLLDSRAPAGAHGHSGGLEAAVTAGFVTGLAGTERFCRLRLATAGVTAAAFAACACRLRQDGAGPAAWAELDAELSARLPAEAARTASRQLGSGLRRLVTAMLPGPELAGPELAGPELAGPGLAGTGPAGPWAGLPRPAPHHPLVLGAAVALAGGDPRLAGVAAALGSCAAPASAAVRLLGLDPYAVQAMLARLAPDIDAAAGAAALPGDPASLPAASAPALDLLADVHARSEVRLFAS
jgi:urease accessory protein